MRKVGTAVLVLLAGCSGGINSDPGSVSTTAAPTTTTAVELPTTTTEAVTTTTEAVPEPVATQAPVEFPVESSTTVYTPPVTARSPASVATGNCGGSLPPCYVMARESRGSLTVYNYEGSGASGKWQIMPGTWDGYGGYDNAADAPESVQDAKARELWAGGSGCAHWSAC